MTDEETIRRIVREEIAAATAAVVLKAAEIVVESAVRRATRAPRRLV